MKYFYHTNLTMKPLHFLFFVLFVEMSVSTTAQKLNPVDTANVKCTYMFRFLSDSIEMEYNDDSYIVNIGNHITKSYCHRVFFIDSLASTPEGGKKQVDHLNYMLKNTPFPQTGALDLVYRGDFQFYLYKDYHKEKVIVSDNVSTYHFHYEDELKPQDWIILEDTMTILNYSCQKAVCSFRGRDWVAWFAPSIPVSEGPLKFQGLPGLIMKIDDTLSHYCFELEGLQHISEPIFMEITKKSQKIDRKSFLKILMGAGGERLIEMEFTKISLPGGIKKKGYDYFELDYKE